MGGFTAVYLKDTSEENITKQNEILKSYGVAKMYRFYSIKDVEFEYSSFLKNEGDFPEHQFDRAKIKTFKDFKKVWCSLPEIFVPKIGSITFDCYFGRTSKRAMRNMGKYFANHINQINYVYGSFTTFMERGMTKKQQQVMVDYKLKDSYDERLYIVDGEIKFIPQIW